MRYAVFAPTGWLYDLFDERADAVAIAALIGGELRDLAKRPPRFPDDQKPEGGLAKKLNAGLEASREVTENFNRVFARD